MDMRNLQQDNINNNLQSENEEEWLLHSMSDKLSLLRGAVLKDMQQSVSTKMDEVLHELRMRRFQEREFQGFEKIPESYRTKDITSQHYDDDNRTVLESNLLSKQLNCVNKDTYYKSDKLIEETSIRSSSPLSQKRCLELGSKKFTIRESYLTALFDVDHMKTIYRVFHLIFAVFLLNNTIHEYFIEKRIHLGFDTIRTGFAGFHYVVATWLFEMTVAIFLYYLFQIWGSIRQQLNRNKGLQRLWSLGCLWVYVGCQIVVLFLGCTVCHKCWLPFPSALTLQLETIRLMMKMHAFIRTNSARIVSIKEKSESEGDEKDLKEGEWRTLPPFQSYFYFLFAPTLIYRDQYPRTSYIRWKFVAGRLIEFFGIIFIYAYVFNYYMAPSFRNYGLEPMNYGLLIVKLFSLLLPLTIIFLCGFYLLLHTWLNLTGELLRFGDRMFYKGWWTASNYESYYREWNVVVHDWLFEYCYKDFYRYVFRRSKLISSLTVFTISAVFHEVAISFSLHMFFPVLYLFFGVIGVLMVFVSRYSPKTLGNFGLWFSLIFGNSIIMSLYTMEHYARINCPVEHKEWTDYLIPNIFRCPNLPNNLM